MPKLHTYPETKHREPMARVELDSRVDAQFRRHIAKHEREKVSGKQFV